MAPAGTAGDVAAGFLPAAGEDAAWVTSEEMDRRLAEDADRRVALVTDTEGRTVALRYETSPTLRPDPATLVPVPVNAAAVAACQAPLDLRAFEYVKPGRQGVAVLAGPERPGRVLPLPADLRALGVRSVLRAGTAYRPLVLLLDERLQPLAVIDNLQTKLIPEGLLRYGSFGWEGRVPPSARWLVVIPAGEGAAASLPSCPSLAAIDVQVPAGTVPAPAGTVIVEFAR